MTTRDNLNMMIEHQRMRQVFVYKRLKLTVSRPQKWWRSLTGGCCLLEVPTVRLKLGNFGVLD